MGNLTEWISPGTELYYLSDVRSWQADGFAWGVAYGLNRLRFPAPLPVDSRVGMRLKVSSVDPVPGGGTQITIELTFEREGEDKPVCVAESLARVYAASYF